MMLEAPTAQVVEAPTVRPPLRLGLAQWLVGGFAYLVRVAYVLGARRHAPVLGDSYFYFYQGKAIARGQGFIVPFTWELEHRAVQAADHPPIFPLFLALLNKIGITSAVGQMLVNSLVGAVTVLLVIQLARTLAGPRTALVAGLFAAVSPDMFSYDGFLLSETWAMLLLVASALVITRFLRKAHWKWALLAGLSIGVVSLARAEFLMAVPLLGIYLLVTGLRGRHAVASIGLAVLVGLAAVATVSPWLLYNRSRFDRPVGMTVGLQFTMAVSNCDSVYFGPQAGYWDMTCIQPASQRAAAAGGDESIMAAEAFLDAKTYIRAHMRRALELPILRVGRVLGLYRPIQQANLDVVPEGRERIVAFGGLAIWYLYAGLGVVGVRSLVRRRQPVFPLLLPGIVVVISVAITFGSVRYRAGFEPFICVLAAIGLAEVVRGFRHIMSTPTESVTSIGAP
jgi:4-amino-4-deoxy-L-arabinose transferase-like glycosyltransferase